MQYRKNQARSCVCSVVLCTALLSACGGDGATPASSDTESAMGIEPMQLSGTIVVEERNGKTVLDGWFVQSLASDTSPALSAGNHADDDCHVSSVTVENVLASSSGQPTNDFSQLQSIDGDAGIASRAGEFDSLVRQEVDGIPVYAPEERWQSVALPDDAVLTFDNESVFSQMSNVDVPPLLPLVWLTPTTGVMANAASTLEWEPSDKDDVRINLKLSAIDFSDSENPTVSSIDCNLIDDGQFALPVDLQQTLPDDHSGIVVYAVREHVQQIQNEETLLTVVQLSYPRI